VVVVKVVVAGSRSRRLVAGVATSIVAAVLAGCGGVPSGTVFHDQCQVLTVDLSGQSSYYYDASAGDHFNAFSRQLIGTVAVAAPDGSAVTPTSTGSDLDGDHRRYVLPATGRYRVSIASLQIGSTYTLCLSTDRDLGPIGLGYTPVSGPIDQSLTAHYAGTAGERLNVTLATIEDTSGSPLPADPDHPHLYVLPTTGDYPVVIGPLRGLAGAAGLYHVVDVGPLQIGTNVVAGLTGGLSADYTYAGSAGQQLHIRATSNTYATNRVTLAAPDGSAVVGTPDGSGGWTFDLAVDGAHRLTVTPPQDYYDTVTVEASLLP
jgi:hypothetical protein